MRRQFEVQRLIEQIWYIPVSLVTCVMAALSVVLSVARRVARNVLFQHTIQLPCYSKCFPGQYTPCRVSLQRCRGAVNYPPSQRESATSSHHGKSSTPYQTWLTSSSVSSCSPFEISSHYSRAFADYLVSESGDKESNQLLPLQHPTTLLELAYNKASSASPYDAPWQRCHLICRHCCDVPCYDVTNAKDLDYKHQTTLAVPLEMAAGSRLGTRLTDGVNCIHCHGNSTNCIH